MCAGAAAKAAEFAAPIASPASIRAQSVRVFSIRFNMSSSPLFIRRISNVRRSEENMRFVDQLRKYRVALRSIAQCYTSFHRNALAADVQRALAIERCIRSRIFLQRTE